MTRAFVLCLALWLVVSPATADDRIEMTFAGDVAFPDGRAYVEKVDSERAALFRFIAPLLSRSDVNFVNLECPLSQRPEPPPTAAKAQWVYRCRPGRLEYLLDAGFNLFSLANNHALDQGMIGVRETLDAMTALQRKRRHFWLGLHAAPVSRVLPLTLRRGEARASLLCGRRGCPETRTGHESRPSRFACRHRARTPQR